MRRAVPPVWVLAVAFASSLAGGEASGPSLDLGDITAGGDGTGNAPPGNTGIDPRNGKLTTDHGGEINLNDPEASGLNPSPVEDTPYIDSVFFLDLSAGPPGSGAASAKITRSGVTFDSFHPWEGGRSGYDYILKDRNGGISTPGIRVGGIPGVSDSAVGIFAHTGITYRLDALRARHGVAHVGCFTAFWGLDDCQPGDANLYAILSDETGVLAGGWRRFHATPDSGEWVQLPIPAHAKYLTLCTGANNDGMCGDGTFAEAKISAAPCPPPSFVEIVRLTPSVLSTAGGEEVTISGHGFRAGQIFRLGGVPIAGAIVTGPRTVRGSAPSLPPGLHAADALSPSGGPAAILPAAVEVVAPTAPPVAFTIETPSDGLSIETVEAPPGAPAGTPPLVRVNLRGADPFEDPGMPVLPAIRRHVVVPAGARPISVKASARVSRDSVIPAPGLLAAGQLPQPSAETGPPQFPVDDRGRSVFHARPAILPLDTRVLDLDRWPGEVARLVRTFDAGERRVAEVLIFPVQWSPMDRNLILHGSLELSLSFAGGEPPAPAEDFPSAMNDREVSILAVNPGAIPPSTSRPIPQPDAAYLIITDENTWTETLPPMPSPGNGGIVAAFQKLADWKTQKGVKAAVVTVKDIVNGRYGNFSTCPNGLPARDLPEIIRNFIKYARSKFNTYYVLIGGDQSIVPARHVGGNCGGVHWFHNTALSQSPLAKPGQQQCTLAGYPLGVRFLCEGQIGPETALVSQRTGRPFHRVPSPDAVSRPGWAYMTDDRYAVESASKTKFILLSASMTDMVSSFYALLVENSIPTDLYYASIRGPDYDLPGLHDWDKNDNGIYGQYDALLPIDGVSLWPDLAVGRASIKGFGTATSFVSKVIDYEKYRDLPPEFGRKVLFASDNWGPVPAVVPSAKSPPEKGEYLAHSATWSFLHFDGSPGSSIIGLRLIAWNSAADFWEVPFDSWANSPGLGYYFADENYIVPSMLGGISGTERVLVHGPAARVAPKFFYFDAKGADLSLKEKNEIRDLLAAVAPGLDIRRRLYKDFLDAPDPGPDLSALSDETMHAELDSGYSIVTVSGHGWSRGCCGMELGKWLPRNGHRGGLVYADSCLTGAFDEESFPADLVVDAIGEIFPYEFTGGSTAYIGHSRFGWIGHGHIFEKNFWQRLVNIPVRLGNLHGTKALYAGSSAAIWSNFALTLFGDPEMTIWSGTPLAMAVAHPPTLREGMDLSYTVEVSEGGAPLPYAQVCISGPRGLFELASSDLAGRTQHSTANYRAGDEIVVTVTRDGYIPYQGKILVKSRFASKTFVRTDTNGDSGIDLGDAIFALNYLFAEGKTPDCLKSADSNDDGELNIADAVFLLNYLFANGPAPAGPYPGCGDDLTPDALSCESFGECP